jgi:hypothetical protein
MRGSADAEPFLCTGHAVSGGRRPALNPVCSRIDLADSVRISLPPEVSSQSVEKLLVCAEGLILRLPPDSLRSLGVAQNSHSCVLG